MDPETTSTDTENRKFVLKTPGPRVLYLVEDLSDVYASYLDRFFLFTESEAAIQKAKDLGYEDGGFTLVPEKLVPGFRHSYQCGHVEIIVIAIELTGALR
jgi:hypothetical protein